MSHEKYSNGLNSYHFDLFMLLFLMALRANPFAFINWFLNLLNHNGEFHDQVVAKFIVIRAPLRTKES